MSIPLLLSTVQLAGGLLIVLMGLVILRDGPRSAVNRATALMLFAGGLGSLLGGLSRLHEAAFPDAIPPGFVRHFSYLWEFFFPSLLYFATVYPRPLVRAGQLRLIETALYLPHVCHLLLGVFFSEGAVSWRRLDPWFERFGSGFLADFAVSSFEIVSVILVLVSRVHVPLFWLVNLTYASLAVGLLVRSRGRIGSARLRGQVGLVLAGLTLCVLAYVLAKSLPALFPHRSNAVLESALIGGALLVASSTIAVAIVRYRFLDMQNLARRSILYGATAAVFALFYVVVVRRLLDFSSAWLGAGAEVLEAGFLVVAVIAFQPFLTAVEESIGGLLARREGSDPRRLLQEFARSLATEVDLSGVRQRVSTSLRSGLMVSDSRLVIVEPQAEGQILDAGEARITVEPGSALAAWLGFCAQAQEPVLRRDLERSLPLWTLEARAGLPAWIVDFHILVPIFQQGDLRGILTVGPKLTGGRFHAEDMALVMLLAQQITTSLENLRLLSENVGKRILEEEIRLASEIQKRLLPKNFPTRAGYRTHAVSFASKQVGGDYFDIFEVADQRLHLAIADVSGKGVPAALLMSYLRAALRSNADGGRSPGDVLTRINQLLFESTAPERFATFFYSVLDTERHEMVYANAGHNYPILVSGSGRMAELSEGGLVLGVLPDSQYLDGRLRIDPGDVLCLYTDGITEAMNASEEEYGVERLKSVLSTAAGETPERVVESILESVHTFCAGCDPQDDLTILIAGRLSQPRVGVSPHGL